VDIYITNKPYLSSSTSNATTNNLNSSDWRFYSSELTDNHGKLKYVLPNDKRLSLGMYMVKMIVKCDHTVVEFNLTVLPANTEAVVFSIDGSFAANISFSGTDPKVRAGAVDVVRHWQDLGYLIIYITARPDIQHYKVTNWLAQHNFPLGMVYFSDGLSRDPIRQKTETLRNLVLNNSLKLHGAYGSAKDIPMYASLGLPANRIFMIGKMKEKYANKAVVLKDGYATHLSMLQNPNSGFRHATGNARLFIKKTTFTVRQNALFSSTLNLTNPVNSQANFNQNINTQA
jgi:phosphatidate phosphatase PAH1